jgi:lambda repressor-like predicted transcriptional regulator
MTPDDSRLAAPDFPHGEDRGYSRGCPCQPCQAAHTAASVAWRRRAQQGRNVSTIEAREHVLGLLKRTNSKSVIARAAGVSPNAVRAVLTKPTARETTVKALLAVAPEMLAAHRRYVSPAQSVAHIEFLLRCEDCTLPAISSATGLALTGLKTILEGDQKHINIVTEKAILGLTPYVVRRNAYLVGPRRAMTRLRALQAQEWSWVEISRMLDHKTIRYVTWYAAGKEQVTQEVDRRIEALYNKIGDRRGNSPLSADVARRRGFYPAIHYDEDMHLILESIPSKMKWAPAVSPEDRARRNLRIMGLTLREYSMADTAMTIEESEKIVERARRAVGLKLEQNRGVLVDMPYIKPGQDALVALIAEHTAPIALLEGIESVDKLGTDYVALWDSLVEGAKRLRADVGQSAEQAAA